MITLRTKTNIESAMEDWEKYCLNNRQISLIKKYIIEFRKFNKKFNISSRNVGFSLEENIFDSLMGLDILQNEEIIVDIGTGGGLPGIPLAINLEKTKFVLVDANRKKCSFLRIIKHDLNLYNVQVLNDRLENLQKYDCIISKAAFSLPFIPKLALHIKPKGRLYLWTMEESKDLIIENLKPSGLNFFVQKSYNLPSGKPRAIIGFKLT